MPLLDHFHPPLSEDWSFEPGSLMQRGDNISGFRSCRAGHR